MMTTPDILAIAGGHLAKRLCGEDPANDSTTWSRRAAKGLNVFRDEIRNAMNSMQSGWMKPEHALEIIETAGRGIDAFIELDTPPTD